GLPGAGKSTLARGLAERAGFTVIRSDEVRKELAGISCSERGGEGVYMEEWTERTYAECLRRVSLLLFEGRRVIMDATFGLERGRRAFLGEAARWGVPALLLLCRADPDTARQRLDQRQGDVSDAGWAVHQWAVRRWEEPGESTRPYLLEVSAGTSREGPLTQALQGMRDREL